MNLTYINRCASVAMVHVHTSVFVYMKNHGSYGGWYKHTDVWNIWSNFKDTDMRMEYFEIHWFL